MGESIYLDFYDQLWPSYSTIKDPKTTPFSPGDSVVAVRRPGRGQIQGQPDLGAENPTGVTPGSGGPLINICKT